MFITLSFNGRIMFWIQLEGLSSSSIVKAPMDAVNGQNMSLVTKFGLKKPTSIAVDYIGQRVFWVDAGLMHIGLSDFDGGDFNTIKRKKTHYLPQHLLIYEGSLYWSGNDAAGTHSVIFKFGIFGLYFEDERGFVVREELVGNFSLIKDFDVYHSQYKLRAGGRYSAGMMSNGQSNCSSLAVTLAGPAGFTCVCPKGMTRDSEGNCTGKFE